MSGPVFLFDGSSVHRSKTSFLETTSAYSRDLSAAKNAKNSMFGRFRPFPGQTRCYAGFLRESRKIHSRKLVAIRSFQKRKQKHWSAPPWFGPLQGCEVTCQCHDCVYTCAYACRPCCFPRSDQCLHAAGSCARGTFMWVLGGRDSDPVQA